MCAIVNKKIQKLFPSRNIFFDEQLLVSRFTREPSSPLFCVIFLKKLPPNLKRSLHFPEHFHPYPPTSSLINEKRLDTVDIISIKRIKGHDINILSCAVNIEDSKPIKTAQPAMLVYILYIDQPHKTSH